MALSPPKSCSVDKWKYILLPSNHKAPLESVCLPGELMFYFQLAVERFGLYMLLQGLGRIYTAQRAVEPLSLYGGVGGDTPSLFFYAVAAIRHISADPIEAHSHEI